MLQRDVTLTIESIAQGQGIFNSTSSCVILHPSNLQLLKFKRHFTPVLRGRGKKANNNGACALIIILVPRTAL